MKIKSNSQSCFPIKGVSYNSLKWALLEIIDVIFPFFLDENGEKISDIRVLFERRRSALEAIENEAKKPNQSILLLIEKTMANVQRNSQIQIIPIKLFTMAKAVVTQAIVEEKPHMKYEIEFFFAGIKPEDIRYQQIEPKTSNPEIRHQFVPCSSQNVKYEALDYSKNYVAEEEKNYKPRPKAIYFYAIGANEAEKVLEKLYKKYPENKIDLDAFKKDYNNTIVDAVKFTVHPITVEEASNEN